MNPNAPSLAIVTNSWDRFRHRRYLVKLLVPRWEAMGAKVFIVDEKRFVPADAALLHVDLTMTPAETRAVLDRYPRVLNGVHDIRKRRFSRQQLAPAGACTGPVIVKTDWNCGGMRDFHQRLRESKWGALLGGLGLLRGLRHLLAWFELRRSWSRRSIMKVGQYRVFASKGEVPAGVWKNPNLVVEQFLAEREGNHYCCRHWLFCGSREVSRRTISPNPTVKGRERIEPLDGDVPEELRRVRQDLGFDFGKFDYGIVNGKVVLYDVNRTPGAGAPDRHAATVDVLAPGLRDFLPDLVQPILRATRGDA